MISSSNAITNLSKIIYENFRNKLFIWSSVALLENGKIKYALSEERINRKKTVGKSL